MNAAGPTPAGPPTEPLTSAGEPARRAEASPVWLPWLGEGLPATLPLPTLTPSQLQSPPPSLQHSPEQTPEQLPEQPPEQPRSAALSCHLHWSCAPASAQATAQATAQPRAALLAALGVQLGLPGPATLDGSGPGLGRVPGRPGARLSLSHTGQGRQACWLLAATSAVAAEAAGACVPPAELGVDIEFCARAVRPGLGARIGHPADGAALRAAPPLALWVAKEAAYKALSPRLGAATPPLPRLWCAQGRWGSACGGAAGRLRRVAAGAGGPVAGAGRAGCSGRAHAGRRGGLKGRGLRPPDSARGGG